MHMEETLGSGDRPGVVVKKRTSSGCLIVRRKGDSMGGTGVHGSRRGFAVMNERTSPRLAMSDSESSEEDLPSLPPPSRRGVATGTIPAYNGLSAPVNHVAEESELNSWSLEEKRKRIRVDSGEFDHYNMPNGEMLRRGLNGVGKGKKFVGSPTFARGGHGMELESGSSKRASGRKNMYIDTMEGLSCERLQDIERMSTSTIRGEHFSSDKPIRIQGKNGVLKVYVNKKRLHGSSSVYERWKNDNNIKGSSYEGMVNKKLVVSPPPAVEQGSGNRNSLCRMEKKRLNGRIVMPAETNFSSEEDLGGIDMLLNRRSEDAVNRNIIACSSKAEKRRASISVIDRGRRTCNISKASDGDSDNTNASSKQKPREVVAPESSMRTSLENKRTPNERILAPSKSILKRGSGTEKQKLRENLRNMLLSAGWKIDYKPRRNRDYLDAVYISPSGTSYWSIIKAYEALQKQLDNEAGVNGERSAFVVSDEILKQLTRKTQKKMEKELKKKQSEGTEIKNMKEASMRKTSNIKEGEESTESYSAAEKPSPSVKQGGNLFKGTNTDCGLMGPLKKSSEVSSSNLQGRKNQKLGRCTLLIRKCDEGLNGQSDGFVPYTGKRTILSWLIDSGLVELGQKVNYMNRGKTRVLLEGWITREGIHCGCCSKILAVSKFEIHAGSKQKQTFQHIYLDSGVSLLQCQIDAWNRQEESDRVDFHGLDANMDDPSDDTCGLCGDGGDLIFCDGCPLTFHQSCLNVQVPSQEDWYCPNCRCRYCGSAGEHVSSKCSAVVGELHTCNLCERRFHKSCIKDMDGLVDSVTSDPSLCSGKCRGLFEHLQKNLGLKHQLEAGFSWSLIRRTDSELDLSLRGHPHRIECNSKLAVAMSIMDECFLPVVDRRTGINIMHSVLYSCRSNLSRINYGGFYTFVLERGDEIISAASLRFHGTQLAEVPFIGTHAIYRRQGMCRRLFSAIETTLQSLKVEKLIIPDIPELRHMWASFGFIPAAESLKLQMRSLNMLVFSGLDILQKRLLKQENSGSKGISDSSSDAQPMEIDQGKKTASSPLTTDETDGDMSSEQVHKTVDAEEEADFNPDSRGGSSYYTRVMNCSPDDARNRNSAELVTKSSESELEQSKDSSSYSEGSSEEVGENLGSNTLAEVSTKQIYGPAGGEHCP
ncbi:hypothetical protein SAY87_029853 [Trapa incisa]|uniref:PHD-type domain-containing protein n=1 Tax=Trapa incisa TaxID=236973 RepID=A0AAN7KBR7_9MYRT|nr:hypothetical protein SAY87_029853 [Trapa incisa]